MSSFSFPLLSQPSTFWLFLSLWPPLPFLPSEPHVQLDVTLLLLFLISLLYFKHFGIILGDVGGNRRRHSNIEEKAKTFLFCLCIVDLGAIMEFFG